MSIFDDRQDRDEFGRLPDNAYYGMNRAILAVIVLFALGLIVYAVGVVTTANAALAH